MQTKLTVYPELKFINRAWRVNNVYTAKDALEAAGVPILNEHDIPRGMIYAQRSTLHDLDKTHLCKMQSKRIHELELAVSAANDVISQKDMQLQAMHLICCNKNCPVTTESSDLASLDDESLKQVSKKLSSICAAWESKHGAKLKNSDVAQWTDGKFDAMITAASAIDKNEQLQKEIKQITKAVSTRNQIIASLLLGFIIEQLIRFCLN